VSAVRRAIIALTAAVVVAASTAACQGASRETLAAGYSALASAANAASAPLLESLASTDDPATRGPILRGLADVETTFANGLAALPTSGDVKAAADDVVRLSRDRAAAFLKAASATGPAQSAALAPILGAGGDQFHAAVVRLRSALGLPPADVSPAPSGTPASPSPSPGTSPSASPAGVGPARTGA
jgi:hypothetical protein